MPTRTKVDETGKGTIIGKGVEITLEFQKVFASAATPTQLGVCIGTFVDTNPCLETESPEEEEEPEEEDLPEDESGEEGEQPDDAYDVGDVPDADRELDPERADVPVLDHLSWQEVAERWAEVEFSEEDLTRVIPAISRHFAGEPIPLKSSLKERLDAFLKDVRRLAKEEEETESVEPFLRVGRSKGEVEVFAPPEWERLRLAANKTLLNAFPEEAHEAQNLIASIRAHQTALRTLAEHVVERQAPFFTASTLSEGMTALRPMTQKSLETVLKCSESTISKLLKGKYVETPFGVIPLRWLFQRPTRSEANVEQSRLRLEVAVRQIIEREDKRNPLSDEKIAQALKREGFKAIQRRVVVNIREKLNLGNSRERKQRPQPPTDGIRRGRKRRPRGAAGGTRRGRRKQ